MVQELKIAVLTSTDLFSIPRTDKNAILNNINIYNYY